MASSPPRMSLLAFLWLAACAGGEKLTHEADRTAPEVSAIRARSGPAKFTTFCNPKGGGPLQITPTCIEITGPPTMLVNTSEQYECRGYAWVESIYGESVPGPSRAWRDGNNWGRLVVPNYPGRFNTISAVSPGTATVKCDMGYGYGSLDIEVFGPARVLVELTISPSSKTMDRLADFTLRPVFRDQYGELNKITPWPTVSWSSADTSVALVSQSGVVTARDRGTTTITATAQGKQGTATVTVLGVASISLSTYGPPVATIGHQNDTYATVTCDLGFPCPNPVWSSSNTSIMSVWPMPGSPTTGKRQGVALGTASVTACADIECASALITVYSPLTVSVSGRSLVKSGQTCIWNGSASAGVGPYVFTWAMNLGSMNGGPEPGDQTMYVGTLLVAPASLYLNVRDSRGVLGAGWKSINFTTTGPDCVY